MASKKGNNWEQQILNEISQRRRKTYFGKNHPSLQPHEHPNYKVFEFSPNRAIDGDKRDLIAGPEWSIMLQSSLLKAGHDMLGRRLGFSIDFEEWFKAFEYEFMKALPPSKQPVGDKLKPWGKPVESRPKKLNLLTKDEAAQRGYMIIRFWKDRKQENNSILISGTYTELRWKLEDLMRDKPGAVVEEGTFKTGTIKRVGKPQIFLYFLEDLEDVEEGYSQVKGIISFRVMDKDDNPDSDIPKITKTDLERYANTIKQQFYLPQPYAWKKGKEIVCYHNWEQGYQLQLLCRSEAAGIELAQKVLTIQGHSYNATRVKHNVTKDAASAYPTVPPQINVLGRNIRAPRKRPVAAVTFQYAQIQLQNWPTRITLLDTEGEVLPNFRHL
jgi:hypothetical protein